MELLPIPIKSDSVYIIKDRLVHGSEILNLEFTYNLFSFPILGALSIGFVLGWNLFFVNRYLNKETVTINHLVVVSTTLLGTTILGFFVRNAHILGAYGIGLLLGFLVYFVLLMRINDTQPGAWAFRLHSFEQE